MSHITEQVAPAPVCAELPLTPAQKGIWLGQQKIVNSPCYNTAQLCQFDGDVDFKKLQLSVAQVLTETISLHCVLNIRNAGIFQIYVPETHVREYNSNINSEEFSQSDLLVSCKSTLREAEPSSEALQNFVFAFNDQYWFNEWLKYWSEQPILLTSQKPFRHAFLRMPDKTHAWFLQIHHIACDGFTYALINRHFSENYSNLKSLKQTEKAIFQGLDRFTSFVNRQCEYESSKQFDIDKQFWREQYRTHNPYSPKGLRVIDSTAATAQRFNVAVSSRFMLQLKSAAKAVSHDWVSLLKAIVAYWFHLSTGENQITFGCPEMNRRLGVDILTPGLAMNILPLCVQFGKNDNLLNIAKKIQSVSRASKAHADFRYENFSSILRELYPSNGNENFDGLSDATNNSLKVRPFGPIINILPFEKSMGLGTATMRVEPISAGPVEDIALYFTLNDTDNLSCHIEFHPELYHPQECEQMCTSFSQYLGVVLDGIIDEANLSLKSCLSNPVENSKNQANNIFAMLEQQRTMNGEKPALKWLSEDQNKGHENQWQCLDYKTLCTCIADIAQTLAQAGLQKGQKCIIATQHGPWPIMTMFGCLALQAEFIGVDVKGPSRRLQNIFNDSQPALVVVESSEWLVAKSIALPDSASIISISTLAQFAMRSKIATARAMDVFSQLVPNESPAYSIYTSGSTGAPKAVQISQDALSKFIDSANQVYEFSSDDVILQFAPLHFDACIEEIFISLTKGATLCIRPPDLVNSIQRFNQVIAELELSILDLPTAFFHEWVRFNKSREISLPICIKTVIIGGEYCAPTAIADFFSLSSHAKLINTYGPSEATVVTTAKVLTKNTFSKTHNASIGSPLPGRSVFILDDQLRVLPKGFVGQMALGGDSLANGYVGQPDLTQQKFIHSSDKSIQQRIYLTGDMAAIHNTDEVIFYGREDEEVKISGQRIHIAEVQSAIESLMPGHQVCVLISRHNIRAFLYAVIAHESFDKLNLFHKGEELKRQLKTVLSDVQIPTLLLEKSNLKTTTSGKLDRKTLMTEVERFIADAEVGAVKSDNIGCENNATFKALAKVEKVWKEVLGVSVILPDSDFFLLGGTSLQLLQVSSRLTEDIAINSPQSEITVADLFAHPKAIDLAGLIASFVSNEQFPTTLKRKVFSPPTLSEELRTHFQPYNDSREPNILLTGATGFIGVQILHALLDGQSKSEITANTFTVTCLIRADSEKQARQKLARACAQQQLEDISHRRDIKVLLGDLTQTNWGLDKARFKNLARVVTVVLHNAAVTSIVRDYQSLKPANVDATQTALRLAHIAGAPFHYISTVAVAGENHLPEDFIDVHDGLSDGYKKSKWAAEYLIQQRTHFGQPVAVYRLPRVVGDATKGVINKKDLVWQIIAASQRAKALPDLSFDEPWIESCEVAKFCANKVFTNENGFFNCVPDQTVNLKTFLDGVGHATQLPKLSMQAWLKKIDTSQYSEDQAIAAFFSSSSNPKKPSTLNVSNKQFNQSAQLRALIAPPLGAYIRSAISQGLIQHSKKDICKFAQNKLNKKEI